MAAPDALTAYWTGVLGSLAVELATAVKLTTEHDGICPPIYKRPFYIFVRALFALVGAGSLPVMMNAASLWSAFYLGISAPLVFDRLARGLQPDKPLLDDLPDAAIGEVDFLSQGHH